MIPGGRRVAAALALLAAVLLAAGCESRQEAERRAAEAEARAREAPRAGDRPQALMIRFRETRGFGFSRETWEIEVLQLGGDVRLTGSMRTATRAIPIAGMLGDEEWVELWDQVSGLPLDRFRVQEDSTAAEEGWTKQLEVDIVLGSERRILSRNTWRRRPVGAPWLDELENHLRALGTEHSLAETRPATSDSTREAVGRALEDAMRELGGTPVEDAGRAP